jgi:hypothetical protein
MVLRASILIVSLLLALQPAASALADSSTTPEVPVGLVAVAGEEQVEPSGEAVDDEEPAGTEDGPDEVVTSLSGEGVGVPSPTCDPGVWEAQFFNNMTLSGDPVLVRCDEAVDFNWNRGSPDPAVNTDGFSARWESVQRFDAGVYELAITADDGVRVFVDGRRVINAWVNQSATTHTARVDLGGAHEIVVEYFENRWYAQVELTWAKLSPPPQGAEVAPEVAPEADREVAPEADREVAPEAASEAAPPAAPLSCDPGRWEAQFFNNMTLSGDPVLVRCDEAVDFNWNLGSPDPAVNADRFSARWESVQRFDAGVHELAVTADDGVRVFVDGRRVINGWVNQPATTYTARVDLGGAHKIVVEFFENGRYAQVELTWAKLAPPPQGAAVAPEVAPEADREAAPEVAPEVAPEPQPRLPRTDSAWSLAPYGGAVYGPGLSAIDNIGNTRIRGSGHRVRVPINRGGTAVSLSVYLVWAEGGYGGGNLGRYRFDVYADNNGAPGARLGHTADDTIASLRPSGRGRIVSIPFLSRFTIPSNTHVWIQASNTDPRPHVNWWSLNDAWYWSASGTRASRPSPFTVMDTSQHGFSHPDPRWRWPRDTSGVLQGSVGYRNHETPGTFWPNYAVNFSDGFSEGRMNHESLNFGGSNGEGPVRVNSSVSARQRLRDNTSWAQNFHARIPSVRTDGVWVLAVRASPHSTPLVVRLRDSSNTVLATATIPADRLPVRIPGNSDSYAYPNGWRFFPFDSSAKPSIDYRDLYYLEATSSHPDGFWFPGGLMGWGSIPDARDYGNRRQSFVEHNPEGQWRQLRYHGRLRNDAFMTIGLNITP